PEYGYKVSQAISSGEFDLGILICGTGIGMCITANKIKGIRAALVHDKKTAQLSRLHNDANVLCLGGKVVNDDAAAEIVDTWLNTSFEGGRHQKRISILSKLTGL
ncbi:MAG: ribose 5-phosphate isomerase B, partial [Calditrichales bacterium]|nr:ribose 5-phosphate isomerase B [Calditrichales bacterium]